MPFAAPLTVRTAAPFLWLVTCLMQAGCGNRGELYLPADVGPETEGLSVERAESAPPSTPIPDVEAERRVVTPADNVNGVAPPVSTDGGEDDAEEETEREGEEGERGGEGAEDVPGAAGGDAR